jgi:hypothetical protein
LFQAGTLAFPNNCFGFFVGDPSGVTRVGHAGLPYPAEFGLPHGPGAGGAIGEDGVAFQWHFADGEGDSDWGIFVDRGQGLETWAGTIPSMPRFDQPGGSFGARMRWMDDGLAFRFDHRQDNSGIFLANGTTIFPMVEAGMIAPDTGAPFFPVTRWDGSGGVIVFEARSEGFPLHGLYVWEAGEISLLAKPGVSLPGDTVPIAWLQDFEVTEDFVFFTARFEDGSNRLFARDSESLIEIQRFVPTRPETFAPWLDLYDHGADGRQIVYETIEDRNRVIYLATVASTITVEIDIKPGNDANPINLRSRGVIPVAILGSDTFDILDVDVDTLAFRPAGAIGAAPAHPMGGHLADVNDDGFTDLLSHYRTRETGIAAEDTEACVVGETLDGVAIEGCGDILVLSLNCGLGFELAFLLPPIMWLRQKRCLN